MKAARQIIAVGGGGLAAEPENPALELYFVGADPQEESASVCFIPTATGDAPTYIAKFYAAYSSTSPAVRHIFHFFERTPKLR